MLQVAGSADYRRMPLGLYTSSQVTISNLLLPHCAHLTCHLTRYQPHGIAAIKHGFTAPYQGPSVLRALNSHGRHCGTAHGWSNPHMSTSPVPIPPNAGVDHFMDLATPR